MSLVAAFLWKKTPASISTLIFDDKTMQIIATPQIKYFSAGYFTFRNEAKKTINKFCEEIIYFHKKLKHPVIIEFKIVFLTSHLPYLTPSSESKFVYKKFLSSITKIKKRISHVKIQPQLRKKLSGKNLKIFNRTLRSFNLVNRRVDTRYEYNLWAIALHATPKTYKTKLNQVKKILMQQFWEKEH